MLIHGDNLASLSALKAGSITSGNKLSVDVILIDPPYNVGGHQGYKNTWKGQSEKRDWAGAHGEFLDFIEPRLKIGRSLLTEEGIMFVNICDGEYCRLKILMDEIFGEENEIATFIWNKSVGAPGNHVIVVHEYIICYAKNKKKSPGLYRKKPSAENMIAASKELLAKYCLDDAQYRFKQWIKAKNIKASEAQYNLIHPKNHRVFTLSDTHAQDNPHNTRYKKPLIHPITKKECPVPKNGWKWNEETFNRLVREEMIWFGKDHSTIPRVIRFLDEHMTERPQTVIPIVSSGKKDLPPHINFTTPKPMALNKFLLSFYPNKNFTVIDYFAGSGSTAHAIHELNREDNGNRNWIMIEQMGSTFHEVLLPRVEHFDPNKDFSIYELVETTQLPR